VRDFASSLERDHKMTDETVLIGDAVKGDLDSFNCLVVKYQDIVFHQAYRLMGDDEKAADAAQEAFILAYKNLRSYRGGSFRAWLLRIVTNTCYDELRRQKRRPTTPLEPIDDAGEEVESPAWMADPGETPEESAERGELSQAFQHCLQGLPDEFRTVVVLVDVQGLDYEEAATAAGTPVGTIKSRLARARLRLRDCLKGFGELLPSTFRQGEES
jgi:RNA polymerase sigma-70 factor (ECF subfamily)